MAKFGVISFQTMTKIHRIFGSGLQINFNSKEENFNLYWDGFINSELGKIYQIIPWADLVRSFNLKRSQRGRPSIFSPEGKIALMILKQYTGLSDNLLLQRLNSDYQFQFFCGVTIPVENPLKNFKIISEIRTELGNNLDIQLSQKVLAQHWKPYINDTNVVLEDATCYETWMRYPTSVKLLWESNEWIYQHMKLINKQLKGRMPRNRYADQKTKYLSYSKTRKKSVKKTRKRIKSLLYLLEKMLGQIQEMEDKLPSIVSLPKMYYKRRSVIENVLQQQQDLYEGKKVKGQIVSIDKSYIRPIVRGKENKRVEFGAKANILQVDGINFIEYISFDAFNEGTRLVNSILTAQTLFNTKTRIVGADRIYATNANRRYCRENGIFTCFVRKGRAASDEPVREHVRAIINKERSTRMEGAFGTQKNYYTLNKVKARTKNNEILWIFFGIHTANATEIAKRKFNNEQVELKKAG